jgi:cysteine-rich repeat protein
MRHISSVVLTLALVAGFVACAGDEETADSSNPTGCTPGQQTSCACPGGIEGVQVCASDGASFGACECNATALCGNGTVDDGEECDDGNRVNDDACSNVCRTPFCGDGIVQEGEDCDDAGVTTGELDTCPSDCSNGGSGGGGQGGGGGEGGGGSTTACTSSSVQVYAGRVYPNDTTGYTGVSGWSYNGIVGFDAGQAMCDAKFSGSKVCTYAQLKIAQGKPASIESRLHSNNEDNAPLNSTIWIHRTTSETINATGQPDPAGTLSAPGLGGRCNDWEYITNDIADGEFAVFTGAGQLTYTLDNDTNFDQLTTIHTQPGLNCGGPTRAIPCCNECTP